MPITNTISTHHDLEIEKLIELLHEVSCTYLPQAVRQVAAGAGEALAAGPYGQLTKQHLDYCPAMPDFLVGWAAFRQMAEKPHTA